VESSGVDGFWHLVHPGEGGREEGRKGEIRCRVWREEGRREGGREGAREGYVPSADDFRAALHEVRASDKGRRGDERVLVHDGLLHVAGEGGREGGSEGERLRRLRGKG